MDEYQGYNVQGSLLKSRLLYIHVTHGVAALKLVRAALTPAESEILSQSIYVDEWYPISLLVALDQAIKDVLANGNEKVYEELGSFSAGINLNGVYEPLLRKRDIHEFFQLTAVLHKSYQNFGEAQYFKLGENAVLLEFKYPQPPPDTYCKSAIGYFRRALELCGASQTNVRQICCQRQNDPRCEFRIEWQA